jgi:positive regulator of sigma E activity
MLRLIGFLLIPVGIMSLFLTQSALIAGLLLLAGLLFVAVATKRKNEALAEQRHRELLNAVKPPSHSR